MLFALLQRSLDQTIDRVAMEEASQAAPQVGRADCARLQRQLFGIVVRRLDEKNARAFQTALAACGFATDLAPETTLFKLPSAHRTGGLHITPEALARTDLYGREVAVPWPQVVFAAAGRVEGHRRERRPTSVLDVVDRGRYGRRVVVNTVMEARSVPTSQWRIDLFFASDPMRIDWVAEQGRVSRLDGEPVRATDTDRLFAFLHALRDRLPPERMNRGLDLAGEDGAPRYPNLEAFEEEVVWHFHRLRSGGA